MSAGLIAAVVPMVSMASGLAPAWADEALPDSAGGRYIFNKTVEGVVRLDTQTGEVALCSQRTVGWACTAAPEDRALLEAEISRLRAENAALKKDILARGLPLPQGIMPEPPEAQNNPARSQTSQNTITVPLPSDADIDRVTAFANRMWHRFKDMVEHAQQQIQQQIFNKS
ncbi:MAG TPA: hypothetical protein VMA30_18210 [Xanthobacteraceae bacterium]|nr:hypothetical protein [Xanthobacteraceae bacterium]